MFLAILNGSMKTALKYLLLFKKLMSLRQTDVDITDFIDEADRRVIESLAFIKNEEIQKIVDEIAEGTITQQEAIDQTNDVNNQYDAQYYDDSRKKNS